ncbi:oxidoreductase subunit of the alternative pyrimidine degradation pathway [Magnetospirillum sp. XM-1]|uniref:malonic semialdehyde reductase n=1 Tax=Magnetospirillum sp. XM-1 TaxID=1663591 RepID=UPI00073DD1C4|nr:malonic semialdehyde reductase [Magnetospirillum sp. XM-1]CUW37678.1 oxidoreductase subunit of the alternative pyrimidine degradation pathway [Magnetospirillum sp. XM-1]
MTGIIDETARQILFGAARTHSKFQAKPVAEDLLRQAWDLARMGPTSVNCQPARIVFVRSAEAKERLKPALAPGNLDKTMAAPVTAIIGHDMEFYEKLPTLFPHADARVWFVGNEAMIQSTAFRNGTLQGAYFILALRGLGLDCGPMSGFDNAKVDAAFFAGTPIRSNFLVNIGYGDPAGLYPRGPRLDFAEACRVE